MGKKIKTISRIVKIEAEIGKIAGEVFDRKKEWIGLGEGWIPIVDVSENESDITVEAELPGVAQGDIHLLLQNNRLEIKGKKKEAQVDSKIRYHRLEREYGPFRRYLYLPGAVNPERTKAVLANGILTVVFKKYKQNKRGEMVLKIKKPEGK
ncbi:MAG: Hsp20/alpha crystallin family protein [Candidatus Aminicenantes bacterium]|nr:Hsp20/alpha crystallin family protein [Candidatus Aminicenantes bacterium]